MCIRDSNESINDTESIDELVNTYDALLEQIQLPISFDEAKMCIRDSLQPVDVKKIIEDLE